MGTRGPLVNLAFWAAMALVLIVVFSVWPNSGIYSPLAVVVVGLVIYFVFLVPRYYRDGAE